MFFPFIHSKERSLNQTQAKLNQKLINFLAGMWHAIHRKLHTIQRE